jgi:hypothetical protein
MSFLPPQVALKTQKGLFRTPPELNNILEPGLNIKNKNQVNLAFRLVIFIERRNIGLPGIHRYNHFQMENR